MQLLVTFEFALITSSLSLSEFRYVNGVDCLLYAVKT